MLIVTMIIDLSFVRAVPISIIKCGIASHPVFVAMPVGKIESFIRDSFESGLGEDDVGVVDADNGIQEEAVVQATGNESASSFDAVVSKKPAVAPSKPVLKRPASSLASGVAKKPSMAAVGEEEAGGGVAGQDDLTELRDRLKARKFDAVFSKLPPFVQKDYEDAQKDKSGSGRSRITSLINRSIKRTADGKLVLADFSGSFFQEVLQRTKRKFMTKLKHGAQTKI